MSRQIEELRERARQMQKAVEDHDKKTDAIEDHCIHLYRLLDPDDTHPDYMWQTRRAEEIAAALLQLCHSEYRLVKLGDY